LTYIYNLYTMIHSSIYHSIRGYLMSAIDLMLLGHLFKESKNAYEIKKVLELSNIKEWVKIGDPTIYQNLVKLHKKGYLDAKITKDSEMPEKTVYTINKMGKDLFHDLMHKYSREVHNIYFDFSAFIVNLDKVDRKTGLRMISDLQKQFYDRKLHLKEESQKRNHLPFRALSLINLYEKLFSLLYEWIEDFRNEYQKGDSFK
jgi:DNA-binding PadR family transcriptional regulator